MKFSITEFVKTEVSSESENELQEILYQELSCIADSCSNIFGNQIQIKAVNASFGSILRNDSSVISFSPDRHNDGYVISAEIDYHPSCWFWFFLILDILLFETVVGLIVGLPLTLWLYFHNKALVSSGISQALRNTAIRMK